MTGGEAADAKKLQGSSGSIPVILAVGAGAHEVSAEVASEADGVLLDLHSSPGDLANRVRHFSKQCR